MNEKKLLELKKYIEGLLMDGICIAFSGGVDSSLITQIACDLREKANAKVIAVTFETSLHPLSDMEISRRVAREMGAEHHILPFNEFEDERIRMNPVDRCYHCKRGLFSNLTDFAKERGCRWVLDGTNVDDLKEYRPGLRAIRELQVISPLAELGISKKEVREMAEHLGLSVAKRPSAPCLATRLPYGTELEPELLKKIEEGEEMIRRMGISVIRMRVHGDITRLEILLGDFDTLLQNREEILRKLKGLGFEYITLDLEGFRSGSMDLHLQTGECKMDDMRRTDL